MSQLVPPYKFISDKLKGSKVIPFLGAGASLGGRAPGARWQKDAAAFLPTAGELAGHLADATEFPPGEQPDLTKVAQYYTVAVGRDALNDELHGIFDRDYPLTPLHSYLARVPAPLLIVTTNYDDLVERAFAAEGKPYDVVVHTTDTASGDFILHWPHGSPEPRKVTPNKLDIDVQTTTVVYKMHGAVDRRDAAHDQYVITEDDYIDFLARMTMKKAIPAVFGEPFLTRHFLFLGYGLRDWNLRVVLNRVEKDLRRTRSLKSWAIQLRPTSLECRFWQERGVEVYDLPLDDFVAALAAR